MSKVICPCVECIHNGKHYVCEVLDKIRAEIERDAFNDVNDSKYIFVNRVNQIIDKYREEQG